MNAAVRERQPGQPEAGRFLRREGNLKVRRERRQRVLAKTLTRIAYTAGAVGLLALLSGMGLRWLITSPAFAVTRLEFAGARYADEATLRRLVSPVMNRNLLTVDLTAVAAELHAHPWVRDVVVRKRLPGTLEIRVEERIPCALALHQGEAYLVDASGQMIDRFGPRYAGWSFPVLTGLDRLPPAERVARCRRATRQVRTLEAASPDLYVALTEVDLGDSHFTVLRLPSAGVSLRVSADDWLHNLESWRKLQGTLQERHGALQYVDLRWQDRLVVLPAAQAEE